MTTTINDRIQALEDEIAALKLECLNAMPTMIQIPERSYSVSETPVTVAQYKHYCNATGKTMPEQLVSREDDNPITHVKWEEANQYCEWLSERTGTKCRLLEEDEFEYCCADHVNGTEETAVFEQPHITAVKTKKPNKFGLYDMLGLVWEWQNS